MKDFNLQLEAIINKHKLIEKKLSNQDTFKTNEIIDLNKEYSEITPIVDLINSFNKNKNELKNLEELLKDQDLSIREIAEIEIKEKKIILKQLEEDLLKSLIPKDINDGKNSILEIRAGTGGDEASLFAADLFSMYQKYSELNSWKFDILSISETGLKGIKEVICNISGKNVFSKLKYESGVHRVQRVPTTENSGRVHTSAATVAVLPEAEEIDIHIEEKDLRIDVFRSSGPGGQSVNTTDSAVRITHLPTKIVVQCQNERSQHKNKETCFKMLKARLYEYELQKREEKSQSQIDSKTEIGWGHQIRSYVLQPYRLVKDLRYKIEDTNPDGVLNGNIDKFIEAGIFGQK